MFLKISNLVTKSQARWVDSRKEKKNVEGSMNANILYFFHEDTE